MSVLARSHVIPPDRRQVRICDPNLARLAEPQRHSPTNQRPTLPDAIPEPRCSPAPHRNGSVFLHNFQLLWAGHKLIFSIEYTKLTDPAAEF
jgi:hypothetical protein